MKQRSYGVRRRTEVRARDGSKARGSRPGTGAVGPPRRSTLGLRAGHRCERAAKPARQSGVAAQNTHSSHKRPAAATSAGTRVDDGSLRILANEAPRSPPSVSAPRPAHNRTSDGRLSALATANRPPTPSTTSRTAKLRVIRMSSSVAADPLASRPGAIANAAPIATLVAANAPTTALPLALSTERS